MVAIFACGLKEDARVWNKLSGGRNIDRELLVCIYDNLNWLVWSRTEDGAEGRNKPEPLYNKLYRKETQDKNEVQKFATAEDFKNAWENIRRRYGNNNS